MRKACLMLTLLFAPVAAFAEPAFFTTTVEGELTISPQGEVVDVKLADADWMGEPVVEGYRQKLRGWRFEPIIENGQAVQARGEMRLTLVAARDDEKQTAHFAVRHVYFPDPEAEVQPIERATFRAPVYPGDAARNGMGAQVILVARVDAAGKPSEIAVEQLHLTGPQPGSHAKRIAGQFARASTAAAKHWTLNGIEPGSLVHLPIKYTPPAFSPPRSGWERIYPVRMEVPDWVEQARQAEQRVLALAEDGSPSTTRLRLLTPLDALPGI